MGKIATLVGERITISARQDLHCAGDKIVEHGGSPVHAATFIRLRRIVLDRDLLGSDVELRRILIHELFHFVWVRLANGVRRAFEELLATQRKTKGELGWSAEYRKVELAARDVRKRSRKWREYCCEAFCDTAAYIYAHVRKHEEFTLAYRFRKKRIEWFRKNLGRGSIYM